MDKTDYPPGSCWKVRTATVGSEPFLSLRACSVVLWLPASSRSTAAQCRTRWLQETGSEKLGKFCIQNAEHRFWRSTDQHIHGAVPIYGKMPPPSRKWSVRQTSLTPDPAVLHSFLTLPTPCSSPNPSRRPVLLSSAPCSSPLLRPCSSAPPPAARRAPLLRLRRRPSSPSAAAP